MCVRVFTCFVPAVCARPACFLAFLPGNSAHNGVFCVASQVNKTVTSINIAGNDIEAEGAKAFAEMLKVCSVCFSLVVGVVVGLHVLVSCMRDEEFRI